MADDIQLVPFSVNYWPGGSGDIGSDWFIGYYYDYTTLQYLHLVEGAADFGDVIFGTPLPAPYQAQPVSLGGFLSGSLDCKSFSVLGGGGAYVLLGTVSANTVYVGSGTTLTGIGGSLSFVNLTVAKYARLSDFDLTVGGDYTDGTGGNFTVEGTVTGIRLSGRLIVASGGTASDIVVADAKPPYGGELVVAAGGNVVGATVYGTLIVYGGAVTSSISFLSGTEVLSSGAIVSGATVNQSGLRDLILASGGKAIDSTISNYATVGVYSGGIASSTTLTGISAEEDVYSGGTAINTIVNYGAEIVYSGGTASGTKVTHGIESVLSGGTAIDTAINWGEIVFSGGTAIGTTVNSGGWLQVYGGADISATDFLGGTEILCSGATLSGITVIGSELAQLTLSSGGTASSTTVNTGGLLFVDGGAASDTVVSGGVEEVVAGGVASATIVSSGGIIETGPDGTTASGTMIDTIVYDGGEADAYYGTAIDTIVSSGGKQWVSTAGTASSTTVSSGGYEYVGSGGIAIRTVVSNGGCEYVFGGGAASDVVLDAGGTTGTEQRRDCRGCDRVCRRWRQTGDRRFGHAGRHDFRLCRNRHD